MDYLPSNLNPVVSSDFWCRFVAFRTILEPLVLVDPTGAVHPHLAKSMEVRQGGRAFRFRLRPGIRFHDGRAMLAADVKYTLEAAVKRARIERSALGLQAVELTQVVEVRAVGDDVVEVVLQRRNRLFPAVLAEIGILPAHLYNKRGLRDAKLNRAPVGTGPFMVPAHAAGPSSGALLLVRNEAYWGRGPGLEKLLFIAVNDPAQALARLRNNELDLIPRLHPGYYPSQFKSERMRRRFKVLRIHPYRLRLLLFNVKRGPLVDRRVRLALAYLTDRPRLVRDLRNDLGQVLSGPLWALGPWYDKSIHPYSFDRVAAGRLLDAAGWVDLGSGKGRRRLGYPLQLVLLRARESERMSQAAAQLKAEFASAGVRLDVRSGDFGYVKAQLRRGRFDLALLGLALRPGSDLSPLLHSKGPLNLGGYDNPEVDRLLDAIRASSFEAHRQRFARQLHRLLHQDLPFIVLYAPIELAVLDGRLRGAPDNGRRPALPALSW